jgi:hypothetical protein
MAAVQMGVTSLHSTFELTCASWPRLMASMARPWRVEFAGACYHVTARGNWGRDLTLWLGRMHCGLKLRELGELAGGLDYATVSVAMRRWAERVATDKKLMKLQQRATQLLNAEM